MTVFQRLAHPAGKVIQLAVDVAQEVGAPTVESEHLLLAATREPDPAAQLLREAGLDYAGLSRALAEETRRSLASVGVTGDAPYFSPFTARPRLGNSAKLALHRGVTAAVAAGQKEIQLRHVVLGVLRAQVGTVPRALEGADVDRAALIARIEAA